MRHPAQGNIYWQASTRWFGHKLLWHWTLIRVHPPFSCLYAMTSAMRPFLVPRAPHRTTKRSALRRTLPLRVRPCRQQSVEQKVLRTEKTTEHQTGESARCQMWPPFSPCLDHHLGVQFRAVDLREASYCRSYERLAEGTAAALNRGRNRATLDTVTTGHTLQTCNLRVQGTLIIEEAGQRCFSHLICQQRRPTDHAGPR